MLAVSMAFAAVWGVVQLTVLGSLTRTVRLRVLLLGVGVGVYAAGVLALTIEFVITRVLALTSSGRSVSDAVQLASFTVDPFVEDIVKVLPLLVLARWSRAGRQWGADRLDAGRSLDRSGFFGLLEALIRFGHRERARRPGAWRRARLPVRGLVSGTLASIPRRPGQLIRAGWPVLLWVILLISALV